MSLVLFSYMCVRFGSVLVWFSCGSGRVLISVGMLLVCFLLRFWYDVLFLLFFCFFCGVGGLDLMFGSGNQAEHFGSGPFAYSPSLEIESLHFVLRTCV